MKQAVDLIFPKNLIREPVICQMARDVPVTFNIRRAKVTEKVGEIVLELEGSEADLTQAADYLLKRGIKVQPITHDTFES
jgi:ABC-type methionine transport system ATPase subunit